MTPDCSAPAYALGITKAVNVLQLGVELVECQDPQRWDSFVDSHSESRFCQSWGFRRALEDAYGLNCVYLNIETQGRLVGVFPSVLVQQHQRVLLSQPFVEYGGPLCSQFTREDFRSLAEGLIEAARARKCDGIVIRGGVGAEDLSAFKDCTRTELQSYGELRLTTTEDIWRRRISQKARNAVRLASKSGLHCEIRCGADAVQPPFCDLYLRSMKRLCIPPHSQRFFEALAANLGEKLVCCWAFKGREPLAVVLGGTTSRRLHCIIMASDERSWAWRPNDLIHWSLIEWAISHGLDRLDLGSSSSDENLHFKRKWGADIHDYAQLSLNVTGQLQSPKRDREHTFGKKLWQLVPLWASHIIGPSLRKRLL